jgi:PKHD-type hydroxylase
MHFQILPILQPAQVDQILDRLSRHPFVDGKVTAQGIARAVKNNQQADRTSGPLTELDEMVRSAFYASSTFQAFTLPKRVRLPIFNRYEAGMNYGAHVDGAIFNDNGQLLRADLAVTLFLSSPDSYDGGELVIESLHGEEEIKLEAGEAVVYSANSVHRVAPVTKGIRFAAVTWVQTTVQDERMRSILFDLFLAMQQIESKQDATLLLAKTYQNLLRITAEL